LLARTDHDLLACRAAQFLSQSHPPLLQPPVIHDLLGPNPTDDQARQVFSNSVDDLLGLSKCPDLVVNRGHYFGTDYLEPAERNDPAARAQALNDRGPGLSDADKRALIEFLKTF
jgi:hypothetical protein